MERMPCGRSAKAAVRNRVQMEQTGEGLCQQVNIRWLIIGAGAWIGLPAAASLAVPCIRRQTKLLPLATRARRPK